MCDCQVIYFYDFMLLMYLVLIRQCVSHGLRLDGRKLLQYRDATIELSRYNATSIATVHIGDTHVICNIHGEIVTPYPDRPREGILSFSSATSSKLSSTSNSKDYDVEICRMLERSIKESDAIDTESLCIVSNEKVWHLKCVVSVVDGSGGSIIDACCLAAMGAFRAFRKPEVSASTSKILIDRNTNGNANVSCGKNKEVDIVSVSEVHIYSQDERESLPLALHHTPLTVTYGIFKNIPVVNTLDNENGAVDGSGGADTLLIADPSSNEEQWLDGSISYSVNAHRELCGLHKPGNASLTKDMVIKGAMLAYDRAMVLHLLLSEALVVLDDKCKLEKETRLEQLRRKQFQSDLSDGHVKMAVASDAAAGLGLDASNPILSWSSLHQSVTTVSDSDTTKK